MDNLYVKDLETDTQGKLTCKIMASRHQADQKKAGAIDNIIEISTLFEVDFHYSQFEAQFIANYESN